MKLYIFPILFAVLGRGLFAQELNIALQLRPRYEYRNGYKTLLTDKRDPASLVSQRSRINMNFENEKLEVKLSFQNIRVWGDVPTLNTSDRNNLMVYQAYGSYAPDEKWSFKLGRQELVYDNQRIFGKVDWAQQGRTHDAFLVTFKPDHRHRIDFGLSVSSENENLSEENYGINNYKNMQFLWYHLNFKHSALSILALNTGYEFTDDLTGERNTQYLQTAGGFYKFQYNNLVVSSSVYGQYGEQNGSNVRAWNAGIDLNYRVSDTWRTGAGYEYLSGTDMNKVQGTVKSFNPLFGTNHAFNGFMDYFYVGNHINSVGLHDVYAKAGYHKNKLDIVLQPHLFRAAASVLNENNGIMKDYLGIEADLVARYRLYKHIDLSFGYSRMFGSSSLEVLKGGNAGKLQHWAWISVNFNPVIFNTIHN